MNNKELIAYAKSELNYPVEHWDDPVALVRLLVAALKDSE